MQPRRGRGFRRLTAVVAGLAVGTVLAGLPSVGQAAAAPPAAAAVSAVVPAVAVAAEVNPGDTDGNFVPLPQATIVDTRSGTGMPKAKIAGGVPVTFAAAGGTTGVPSSGVDAVAVTFTLTNSTTLTPFTAWPAGQTKPGTSTVTAQAGVNESGNGYIKPGSNNQITAQIDSGTTDLIVTVIGYFRSTDDAAGFSPLPGTRVVDTRHGVGAPLAKIPAGGFIDVSLAASGIPTSASAAVVTATVYSSVNSYLKMGPPGQANANSLSVVGDPFPHSVTQIVPVDQRNLRIAAGPAGAVDVLLDVTGYFGAASAGGGFTPASGRVFDTATAGISIPANGVTVVPVLGKSGIPKAGVGAVAVALTAVNPQASGLARIYSNGATEPQIQTLAFDVGDSNTNSAIVSTTLPATGTLLVRNQSAAPLRVVVDVQGWFTPYYDPAIGESFPGGPGAQSFSQFTNFAITTKDRLRVAAASGNALYSAADVNVTGTGQSLSLGRHYNSRVNEAGSFGTGWTLDAGGDIRLPASGANRVLYGPTGQTVTFKPKSGGGWTSPPGIDAALTNITGGFQLKFDRSAEVWTFTLDGQFDVRKDRNGNTVDYSYDGAGLLTSVTDTRGRVLGVTRVAGLITALTLRAPAPGSAVLRTWQYGYTSGRLTATTDPAGGQTAYAYNATTGRLASVTNPRGTQLSLATDTDGRVTSLVRNTAQPSQAWAFSYQSHRTRVEDPNGHVTLEYIDEQGKVTSTTDALAHTRAASYTANGNVASYTPATAGDGGNAVANTFDSLNRMTDSTLPTGAKDTFSYTDSSTNKYAPTSSTDAQGNSTSFTYDAAGNTSSSTDSTPGQGRTTVDRNSDGQPRQETDPKGNVTTYHYDLDGQLTSLDKPAPLGDETYTYDALSRVSTVTTGTGAVRTYTYDNLDRVTQTAATDAATVTSVYDGAGNRTEQTDATGTSTSTYEALNRVTAQAPSVGGNAAYTYDSVGNLLTHTDKAGTVTYRYDAGNNIDRLTEPDAGITDFTYDADNQRTKITWPGGVTQNTDHDGSGRITRIRGLTATATALTDLTYTYGTGPADDHTVVQTVKDTTVNQTTAYTYDGLSRLTQAQTKNSAATVVKTYDYSYDKNGNRTRASTDGTGSTAAFNAADQLCWTGAPGTTAPPTNACSDSYTGLTRYAYDANGNQTTTTPPASTASTATFNAYDQTTGFTPTGQAASAPTYTGATQNGRTTTTDNLGTATRPVTFTRTVLGVTARTTTNPTQVDAYTRDPTGTLITWRTPASGKRSYLTDRQGSVIAVANPDGTIDRRYTYDPYGATTKTNNTEQHDSNPWRYTGEYQDNTTGLYKLGARYYQPNHGRFTQSDPSGQEANTYLYTGSNPVNRSDPSGLIFGISYGDAVGAVVGTAVGVAGTAIACGATGGLGCVAGGAASGALGGAVSGGIGSAIDGDDEDETIDNVGKQAVIGGATGGLRSAGNIGYKAFTKYLNGE